VDDGRLGELLEPISAPIPDCFAPPNGVSGLTPRCLFTQTVPELIRAATPNARSRSDDQTEPPRPKSVSLASADLLVAQRAGPLERPSPAGRPRRPKLFMKNGKGVALEFLGGTCGLLGDSCGYPELPRRDADELFEVMGELALVREAGA
jgi:hypothetical protein